MYSDTYNPDEKPCEHYWKEYGDGDLMRCANCLEIRQNCMKDYPVKAPDLLEENKTLRARIAELEAERVQIREELEAEGFHSVDDGGRSCIEQPGACESTWVTSIDSPTLAKLLREVEG